METIHQALMTLDFVRLISDAICTTRTWHLYWGTHLCGAWMEHGDSIDMSCQNTNAYNVCPQSTYVMASQGELILILSHAGACLSGRRVTVGWNAGPESADG